MAMRLVHACWLFQKGEIRQMAFRSRWILNSCFAALFCIAGVITFVSAQSKPAGAASAGPAALAAIPPAVSCESLTSANVSAAVGSPTHITSAISVQDGKPAPFCEVKGYVEPKVNFLVRLPLTTWTQRFVEVGCVGYCGQAGIRIDNAEGCLPATNGELAVGGTDTGHTGAMGDATFGANGQARIDFAYRGQHVSILAAKAIIQKFYGQAPKYSYFDGCSEGGRESMMEAERFPNDFNGIIAGAPAMYLMTQNTFFSQWSAHVNIDPNGKPILTGDKVQILHRAVLEQCDAADGAKDGLISDPLACHFDPGVTECKPGQDSATCLTSGQVNVAREIYDGAQDSEGNKLTPGGMLPGSELGWQGFNGPPGGNGGGNGPPPGANGPPQAGNGPAPGGNGQPAGGNGPARDAGVNGMANVTYKYLAYETNPPEAASIKDLKFERAAFEGVNKLHGLYDATDADLSPFAAHGGKLILFHGLADPQISPVGTIMYYTQMQQIMGKSAVGKFARFYLLPGVGHCDGGAGPAQVDLLGTLMAWVEKSQAPYEVTASHFPPGSGPRGGGGYDWMKVPQVPTATPDRTRPVFPYPLTAKYIGTGSTDDAKNFVAGPASPAPERMVGKWLGSSFYAPHYELWCTGDGATMSCKKTP